ncbi:hypothetical protein EUGRSUZ_H03134 [Eucalyptus grandis]|uniref:Uncharacterized protein n=2 Tax=Eucalyptus grandis TaxID=71139 RepID=A0ACC3JTY1_EUCGR|nr:hypothetical protein EUGRSUZ_H03134 [Eucalyptus grandis]
MCRSLREIPSSIGDLQNLQNLNLQYTAIEKLPNAIGGLKNLQFLNLIQCSSLKGAIPSEIGDLPSLKTIYLSHSSISKLPESLRNLSSLRSLELSGCKQLCLYLMGCKELWSLPELPSGLTYLFITCQRLGLPQLLRLTHPETLYLDVRYLLEDIRKLSSITLKLCFEEWDKLTSLSLHGLTHLEELSIKKCSSIKRLDLSGLIHLKRLCIEHCKLTSLPLHGLTHLEELSIKKCSSIKRLDVLGLIHLKRLRIEHCDSLVEIMGHNLKSLKVIFLDECKRLKKLSDFNCGNLVEIQAPDGAKFLEELDLTGSERLQSLVDRDYKKLTQL